MLAVEKSPLFSLYRPYFDLGDFIYGPLHLYGVEFSYRNLINLTAINYGIQVINPPSFRESLLKETNLYQYAVDNPLKLNNELRTPRWSKLCEYLTHYQELQESTKVLVIRVLKSLCLHKAILEYVPDIYSIELSSETSAKLALCRAISHLLLQEHKGNFDKLSLKELEHIANYAPPETLTRLNAVLQLVVRYAKNFRDLEGAEFWRAIASQEIQKLQFSLNDFDYKLFASIYYRAVVFVPLLQKDQKKVIEEMDICQTYAENMICVNEEQEKVTLENQCIIFESRTKEAIWLGDLDLAEERARKATQIDTLDPRYRLELGEVLLKQGKIEEAAKIYRSAARLGPPRTAIGWFMAGQCHEKLGDIDIACDCYLTAIQIDELAISAVERLNKLAPRLGNSALLEWSNIRLSELLEQQKLLANQSRTPYIPEASSELKRAGESVMV